MEEEEDESEGTSVLIAFSAQFLENKLETPQLMGNREIHSGRGGATEEKGQSLEALRGGIVILYDVQIELIALSIFLGEILYRFMNECMKTQYPFY